jgi:hypothetical protein
VANNIILPLAAKSVGNITLPSLDSLLPGFHLSLTNVRLNQRGGFIAVYGQLRPTPMAAIAVSTEQPQPGVTNLRFFPTNLNGFNPGPLTFSWTIKDHTTGQVVSAPPYPIAPAVAVYANTDEFATTDTNFGPGKVADAILKVSQPGITVTSQTTFTWNPPSLPPPGTCPNLGPIFLLRTAAVNNGGGGTGGGAPGCPTG